MANQFIHCGVGHPKMEPLKVHAQLVGLQTPTAFIKPFKEKLNMKIYPTTNLKIASAARLLLLASAAWFAGCSTMQATDTGFLKNRSEMVVSPDGSHAQYRSEKPVNPHQVHALSIEWALPKDVGLTSADRALLMSNLKLAISRETEALPKNISGRPIAIRAVITRIDSVSALLNAVSALVLPFPVDRGGAAVEIEVRDADTGELIASIAHAKYSSLTAFKARFSTFAAAQLALDAAAIELAKLLRTKSSG
jgi:hypothetical protein